MAQLIDSLWMEQHYRCGSDVRVESGSFPSPNTARVLVGAARGLRVVERKRPRPVGAVTDERARSQQDRAALSDAAGQVVPFLKNISPAKLAVLLPDLLLISSAFFAIGAISGHQLPVLMLGFYLIAYVLVASQSDSYGSIAAGARPLLALGVAVVTSALFTSMALAISPQPTAKRPLVLWMGLSLLMLVARHYARQSSNMTKAATRHVMIIGNPALGQALFDSLRHDGNVRDVREFLLDSCLLEAHGAAFMSQVARQACIDEVIIATTEPAIMRAAVREAKRNRLDTYIAPDLSGVCALDCEQIGGIPLLKVAVQQRPEWALAGKRVLDMLLSAISLGILFPLLTLITILIRIESPGPVLYRSPRVGQKGRRFNCYKFRTMVPNADALKAKLRALNQRRGAFFKISDDPRTTRVGRFLRRYSLDELPQLWNVLRGDMSLVGPRPHPPDDVARYGVEDIRRLDFVPGITGLWQVTARQDPSFQRCVDLDVEYIESWSLALDFKILWRTIGVVLQGTGV